MMSTATKSFEPLGELYIGTLVENALYQGVPGTIRDAVWASLQGDTQANIDGGLVDAAAKLTRDAMGLVEHDRGWVSSDWLDESLCDWKRLDSFWDMASLHETDERLWVIHQLETQSLRCCLDLNHIAVLFGAAALLLKEVEA